MKTKKSLCAAIIFFLMVALVAAFLSGCQVPGYASYRAEWSAYRATRAQAYMMPPVEAGGCDLQNPQAICLRNTTNAYQARCWVSEVAQPFSAYGRAAVAPVVTQDGKVRPAYLIPPGAEKPVFLLHGRHRLRCELYRGAPPEDAPPYIRTHADGWYVSPNGQEGRVFHLHPDHMRAARGFPAN